MCTGACSKFIAIPLYVLAAVSIICNIILFFPDFKTDYASQDREGMLRLTPEVKYMGGFLGGGIMALIPAIHTHLTSADKCCANRCGMFLSIGFAALGVVGAIYTISVAALGLSNGPVCEWHNTENPTPTWGAPFTNSSGSYLNDKDIWKWCEVPENVVEFNLGLFATLLVAGCVQIVLCAIQMVNGLFGCICGTCSDKESGCHGNSKAFNVWSRCVNYTLFFIGSELDRDPGGLVDEDFMT
ncbi:transmembrane 4 L6 family member 5 [Melanotaenia boesemani]|uniref:transmembrane 4 L6 family member 5 n=1 Tax=Melanotaenia boesemani TaxID=1250792 RepID=UPI001C04FE23|nr:transmembrane 4 L6 family member 5 [Melanotaenia boesemani]